jgi:hypothetical protein
LVPRADRFDEVAISVRCAALVLDGTDLVLLSLRAAGWSPTAECARDRPAAGRLGRRAAAPPCDFPAFLAAGRLGFGGPSRCRRKLPLEGSRERAPFAASWGTETDPVQAGGRSRLTPIDFDTGRAPLICDGLMVASQRRDPAAVCSSRRNSGTAGRSSDYRIFRNFVESSLRTPISGAVVLQSVEVQVQASTGRKPRRGFGAC